MPIELRRFEPAPLECHQQWYQPFEQQTQNASAATIGQAALSKSSHLPNLPDTSTCFLGNQLGNLRARSPHQPTSYPARKGCNKGIPAADNTWTEVCSCAASVEKMTAENKDQQEAAKPSPSIGQGINPSLCKCCLALVKARAKGNKRNCSPYYLLIHCL